MYVIKNADDTNDVSEINTAKEFLTMDEAYAITAADDAGTPASVITGKVGEHTNLTSVKVQLQ